MRKSALVLLVAIALGTCGLLMMSFFSSKPEGLGVREGRLADCPDKPNCVSSQSDDERHHIEPLSFEGSATDAFQRLQAAVVEQPRTRIVTESANYLHAESRSMIFRFVDDLEFFIDADAQQIHIRSASRVGHSDMGVNRDRIEKIRAAFSG